MLEENNMLKEKSNQKEKCGIIRPISAMGDCSQQYWEEVEEIIKDSLSDDYDCSLVSENASPDIIQNTIIQRLYNDSIIVCDISQKNPNVMLELGIRLAFNRKIILICQEGEKVPFDVTNIRTLFYDRTLNYKKIKKFKNDLKTYAQEIKKDPKTFLSTFGNFETYVFKAQKKEVDISLEPVFKAMTQMENRILQSMQLMIIRNQKEEMGQQQRANKFTRDILSYPRNKAIEMFREFIFTTLNENKSLTFEEALVLFCQKHKKEIPYQLMLEIMDDCRDFYEFATLEGR
ncbi:hypothetical protein [Fusobacterium necrophorum]|uniref:hypothetical protein n=1 Tax=Fusobacterium necrophorum TaxID=859 RepID=UPI00370DF34C